MAQNAELYEWCSAAWFAREGGNAFVKTVNSFKIDQVKVYDEYKNLECGGLDTAFKQGGSTPCTMECAGSTALLNTPARQPFKSGVELLRKPVAHRTPAAPPQFKSGVQPPHSKPTHRPGSNMECAGLTALSNTRAPQTVSPFRLSRDHVVT